MKLGFTRVIVAGAVTAATLTAFNINGPTAAAGACSGSTPTTTTTSTSTTSTSTTSTSTTTTSSSIPSATAEVPTESVIITAAGPGGGPHVQIFNGAEAPLASFYAYAPNFTGGVYVAAGDVNGDGYDDVVTAAGPGGGPHVKILNGAPTQGGAPQLNELGGFYAYAPNFTGGVRVAVADVNNDGKGDIITAPGPGGGPHVRVFSGSTALGATPLLSVLGEFMAYSPSFTGGVSVAGADLGDGDANAEIVTGAGPGGGPHVLGFNANGSVYSSFMAFTPSFNGGINVAAACVNGLARIAVGTASKATAVALFDPANGQEQHGGFFYDTSEEAPAFEGFSVALGALIPDENPPMQIITGFSDSPQVLISPAGAGEDIDAFDAYGARVQVRVALGFL